MGTINRPMKRVFVHSKMAFVNARSSLLRVALFTASEPLTPVKTLTGKQVGDMTKMKVTERQTAGPWRKILESGARLFTIIAFERKVASVELEDDADLIVTACNACQAVNPTCPQAVAETLVGLVETAEWALRLLEKPNPTHTSKYQKMYKLLQTSIAKARGPSSEGIS